MDDIWGENISSSDLNAIAEGLGGEGEVVVDALKSEYGLENPFKHVRSIIISLVVLVVVIAIGVLVLRHLRNKKY